MSGDVATAGRSPVRGQPLESVEVVPDTVTLFRFSAATWNAHRIHYDQDYARSEGYADVLVQAHLLGSYLLQFALEWAGPAARVRRFRYENRSVAVPGDRLTMSGEVTAVNEVGNLLVADCELNCCLYDGRLCTVASARIAIPKERR